MSHGNVDTFWRTLDAYLRRDVEGFLEFAHPDVEWRPFIPVLLQGDGAVFSKRAGIERLFRETDETLSALEFEVSGITDLTDRVVATGVLRIRGRGSGAEVESEIRVIVDFEHGAVRKVETHLNTEDAEGPPEPAGG